MIVVPIVSLFTKPLPKETINAAFGDDNLNSDQESLK
jgi:hypothetical protein